MNYLQVLQENGSNAASLEEAYQAALKSDAVQGFAAAVEATYAEQPENLLYAAWHYRLASTARLVARHIPWTLALALAAVNGLLLWLLSDQNITLLRIEGGEVLPFFLLVWAPLAALFVLAYLVRMQAVDLRLAIGLGAALAVATLYAIFVYPLIDFTTFQRQYIPLAALHLPLLAWAAVGIGLLRGLGGARDRFAFVLKSLEVFVLAGLFGGILLILMMVTVALFASLGLDVPEWAQRLLLAGGAGMVPVLVVAIGYDPSLPPGEQSFDTGLSRLVALLLRLVVPVALVVLAIYVALIPFFFWRPFEDRDVLINYNIVLFAVMALLVWVTPMAATGLTADQQRWLRRGIITLAVLALVVAVYALAAILYRTTQEGLTPNRVTFIGWGLINAALLALLLNKQRISNAETWLPALQRTFGVAALLYTLWAAFVVLGLPWLF